MWINSFILYSAGEGDVPLSDRKESGNTSILGSNGKIPVNCFKGIRESSFEKVMWLVAQLKCLYTDACSMQNKERVGKPQ